MSPQYKFTYYDIQGLGEPIRYIFAVAGVDYEDNRIPKNDSTYPKLPAKIKETLPWGSLPLLEVDGKIKIAQSAAICRFLAKRYNLTGANEFESAKCDELVDAVKDFGNECRALMFEDDETRKLESLKKLTEITIPTYMGRMNKIAEENGKYLIGKELTWADIFVAHFLTMIKERSKMPFIDAYPAIKKVLENVYKVPQIKEWMAKRPQTE